LAGEEVDAEVAVLAGLGRLGDADDFAWTALEDQEVTDADEVGGDGDRSAWVAAAARFDKADVLLHPFAHTGMASDSVVDNDFVAVVFVKALTDGARDAVGGTTDPTTNAEVGQQVAAVVVPVVHFASRLDVDVDVCGAVDVHVGVDLTALVFNVEVWVDTAAVLTLSDVELVLKGPVDNVVWSSAVDIDVDVGGAIDVDVCGATDGITETRSTVR
jgi:hypothetical protein